MTERGSIHEPERHVRDAALGLECRIYGQAPVQAVGHLDGHPLYFRARWDGWSFTLSISHPDIDPAGLREGAKPGFFRDGDLEGFALWGDYGTDYEASFMPYVEAERLIRECSRGYFEASGQTSGD